MAQQPAKPQQPPTKMAAADFQFERPLGTGAFSKVVTGLYKPTGARYAVKLISKRTILNAPTDEERTRMAEVARRESRMLLMCEHPSIVKFYGSMQTPEDLLYVTELCEGGELLDAIRARGRISLEASRHAIAELFAAIFYLHYAPKKVGAEMKPVAILHRDIKPENVMLSKNNRIKLIDFGTACMCQNVDERPEAEGGTTGRAQTFCGTTYYMSPELLEDNYTCSASDYWGVGCVLYHMLVGKRPFDAATQYLLIKTILEQEPDYPVGMDLVAKDLVQKLLVKAPGKRIGMKEIIKHPFLSTIDFTSLATDSVEALWVKETPWVDEATAVACHQCKKRLGKSKSYCRNCGQYFCNKCLVDRKIIPISRFATPQPVCEACIRVFER